MTNPITPPPELVRQWIPAGWDCSPNTFTTLLMRIADNAASWSHDHCKSKIKAATDQELKACVEWLENNDCDDSQEVALRLYAARRPKPPSLKEQALALLDDASDRLDAVHENTIRRALEALDPPTPYPPLRLSRD
jgi:hypothetical protein